MPTNDERLVVVTGGARSGKSKRALALAVAEPKALIATAVASDEEMRERIARHRGERGKSFATIEEPLEIARVLGERQDGDVVVDCMTLWLVNVFESEPMAEEVARRIAEFVSVARTRSGLTIAVTNEVGMGIVPPYPSGRRFRDLAGSMNQLLAAAADRVLIIIAGVELRLK